MHYATDHKKRRFAIVLGTNEIASAVAVYLHRAQFGVVLAHDPFPPVIRRKMAFQDALYGDTVQIDGVIGERADDGMQVFKALRSPERVQVTWLGLPDLLTIGEVDILVDARLQKHRLTPDLRQLAKVAIGLGPGFSTITNCDVAIETRPGRSGVIIRDGWTDRADGIARPLGNAGGERFAYSQAQGRWHTAVEIGSRVFKGFVLGHLSGAAIVAPCDGMLRGIVRDSSEVPAGVKLLEIDPRGRHAQWTGIDDYGRSISKATLNAINGCALRGPAITTAQPSYLF
jgi:hypothetical protein